MSNKDPSVPGESSSELDASGRKVMKVSGTPRTQIPANSHGEKPKKVDVKVKPSVNTKQRTQLVSKDTRKLPTLSAAREDLKRRKALANERANDVPTLPSLAPVVDHQRSSRAGSSRDTTPYPPERIKEHLRFLDPHNRSAAGKKKQLAPVPSVIGALQCKYKRSVITTSSWRKTSSDNVISRPTGVPEKSKHTKNAAHHPKPTERYRTADQKKKSSRSMGPVSAESKNIRQQNKGKVRPSNISHSDTDTLNLLKMADLDWSVEKRVIRDPNPEVPSLIPAPSGKGSKFVRPRAPAAPHPLKFFSKKLNPSSGNSCVKAASKSTNSDKCKVTKPQLRLSSPVPGPIKELPLPMGVTKWKGNPASKRLTKKL